jgi:translation initiation factor 2 subunit 2
LEKELLGGEDGAEAGTESKKSSDSAEAIEAKGDPIAGTGVYQHDSTADIPYPMLLNRFFTLLSDRHPDLVGGVAKSFKIPPPQCLREGNKKTLLANLPEISKRLKRTPEHITSFLFAEMGTSGSTDANGRLIIRGRFQSKQIENILRRYIMDYVICKTCKWES